MRKVLGKKSSPFWSSLLVITLSLGFLPFIGVSVVAAAQAPDYPTRPVLFYCLSASPSSGFGITTRAIVTTLTKEKLVTVAMPIEHASSTAGGLATSVTRYKGDPYMVSLQSLNGMMNYATGMSPYNHKNYIPLCGLISSYYAIAVRNDSPYKTLGDLVKDLKEKPEKTPICGGTSDDRVFYGATFAKAGIDPRKISYVAYSGGGESSMAVLEGSVKAVVNSVGELVGLVEGKKLRFLAMSAGKRSPALKDVPTLREAGIDWEWGTLRYPFVAPGVPEYAVKYWRTIFAKMVKTPTWREMLEKYQWDDTFQLEGFNEVLDKKQAIVTEVMTKLGMAKK